MKKAIYAALAVAMIAVLAWGIHQDIQINQLNQETEELISDANSKNEADRQFLKNFQTMQDKISVSSTPKADKPKAINVSLGKFKLTAYSRDEKCCGKKPSNPAYGITSTGAKATEGRTVAVDPKVITYGAKVIINGHEYTAEDCGGGVKGKHIDIFFESYQEAVKFGVQSAEVFLKK